MHIFVINLHNRPKRFHNALENLKKVNLNNIIIRKEACTPERAKKEYTNYISMKAYNNINETFINDLILCNWNMVACAISHIEIWEFIQKNNIREAVIIEDDIFINDINKFKIVYNRGLNILRSNDNSCELKKIFLTFNNTNYTQEMKKINEAFTGMYFYMLNFNMANLLLSKVKPLTYQIDIQIGLIFKSLQSYNSICYNINNDCIKINKKFISDVQYYFVKLYDIFMVTKFNYDICSHINSFLPKKQNIDLHNLNLDRVQGYYYDLF